MKAPLRIIHLEDNPADAELVLSLLEAEGLACVITHVAQEPPFRKALDEGNFDLILSDYTLPCFNGLMALKIARKVRPDIPFIFLSGTIGEEAAVEALKQGATDYMLKDRTGRLAPSIKRAIRDAAERAERQHIEEQFREQSELFRQITESVDDLIAVLDTEGRRIFNSPSYKQLLGDPNAFRGTDSFADVHPDDRERIKRIFELTLTTGVSQRTEYRFVRKDGTIRYIESQGSVIRDKHGNAKNVVVVSRDITERKLAEEQIREQAALLDKAHDVICVTNMDQKILYWNESAERLYGWKAQEALGKNANELLFAEEQNRALEALKALIKQEEWHGELQQVSRPGKKLVVESRWTLLRDHQRKPKSILIINTDITAKKEIEAQLLRAQRVESIGVLASGIAHDLNNILAPILMSVDLLKVASPESLRLTDTIKTSAQRGAEMVKQILSFARGLSGEPILVQISHLVEEIAKFTKETFPRSIQVITSVSRGLFPVKGHATQLHQVLMNLCVNARDAMSEGGVLTLDATNVILKRKQIPGQAEILHGPFVLLTVSDTGTGIPPEVINKVFDPFFTTKEPGKGTGLGLSTVLGIVRNHGGFVEVSTESMVGTAFKVYLPAARSVDSQAIKLKTADLPLGQGETVLIVDDESSLLEIARLTLESVNYKVLTAKNGAEALQVYQQHQSDLKLVLTDIDMPIMDGAALIKALKRMNPELKVVGMSGLDVSDRLKAQQLKVGCLLAKPFSSHDLLLTISAVLRGQTP